MGKIKILMVLGNTKRGGAQSFILNVLNSIDREMFQIDLAVNYEVPGGISDEVKALGGHIYTFPQFKIYNWCAFSSFWNEFLSTHKYNIVHAHSTNSAFLYLKIAKKYGCHTIAHSHSAGYRGGFIETLTKKFFAPKAKKVADYWFACSDKAAERLYGNSYKNSSVYYNIPNAIIVKNYKFNSEIRNQIRLKHGIDANTFVCGHVGTFSVPKNHLFLIDIFTQYYKRNPNSVLMLCGTGDLMPNVKAYAEQKGILNNIIFTGSISNVNEYMMAMDILIFPSLFEGLPTTVVEAQAAGLPVLMSDVITDEVNLSTLVNIESLTNGAETWSEKICNIKEKCDNLNRESYNEYIKDSKFNIDTTINLVSKLYVNLSNK